MENTSEPKKNWTVLEEADLLTNGERIQDYGHPLDDYNATAKIWSGILAHKLKVDITPEEAVLCMVGVKLSRESRKHKRDNLVDGCGYLRCIEKIKDRRVQQSKDLDTGPGWA